MKKMRFISSVALAVIALATLTTMAGNITSDQALNIANSYLKGHTASGSFRAPALADIKLVHAEASTLVNGANDYYAFNINGGGFIIISGEDRTAQVLGYSDKGQLDFAHLPCTLRTLLNNYKQEIEFIQGYEGDDLIPLSRTLNETNGVEPLIKSNWGQGMPYYLQCPIYQDEYCVVGCIATAMAQVIYFWKFPTRCDSVVPYYCSKIDRNIPGLPPTSFNYNLMLNSYCHWDTINSQLVQDTYTNAQAQEVAKLGRYCGQTVKMNYSPSASGAYVDDQLEAMKFFGYNPSAHMEERGSNSWWPWNTGYTTSEWEALMRGELDAGRPILYTAYDDNDGGGHAFICDGYNAEGLFHFNLGWYGTCNGWYVSTALNMVNRSGKTRCYNTGAMILVGIEPSVFPGDVNSDGSITIIDVSALIDYLLSGDSTGIDLYASDINGDTIVSIADLSALLDLMLN